MFSVMRSVRVSATVTSKPFQYHNRFWYWDIGIVTSSVVHLVVSAYVMRVVYKPACRACIHLYAYSSSL
jgi:quinol-cytochrome oxidoreductase complex cytochrome b subunit